MRIKPLTLFVCVFLAGCTGLKQTKHPVVLLDVPFYKATRYYCGVVSLRSVMAYYGVDVPLKELVSSVYNPRLKGSLSIDLLLYARQKGFNARIYRGDLQDLKRRISSGQPIIVMVDYGLGPIQKNHFMVVTGYSGEGVFVHSADKRNLYIDMESFLRLWQQADFFTLLIQPDTTH